MATIQVQFRYCPGLLADPFRNVRLCGSWDASGRPAAQWSQVPMQPVPDEGGRPAFEAEAAFDASEAGTAFHWGVLLDGPLGHDLWGIAAEVDDPASTSREQCFILAAAAQTVTYRLTLGGRLGVRPEPGGPGARASVWAPNAQSVDLVFADPAHAYIADDGTGEAERHMMERTDDGIWDARLDSFAAVAGRPYMFRVVRDDGKPAYRTDLWSLKQIGAGDDDPGGQPYAGPPAALEGPQGCSVVCDPGRITLPTGETLAPGGFSADAFWADEFSPAHPLPTAIEDLVVYELHVGALGYGTEGPGTLADAIRLVGHLATLGVNALELMPIQVFEGRTNWGYGTSHFFAIDEAAGGTDLFRLFVRTCHQHGIAVILDVCYNHFDHDSERAEWAYDSTGPANNIYFWYEGQPGDYGQPDGGYIDNDSTEYAPAFDREMVRQMFISSAAWLVETCHVDGFRLDQTSSIHEYAKVHATQQPAGRANAFGAKFLRQWTRTMRLIEPGLFLMAEDYSGWPAMTEPSVTGDGVGFDATWYGDFQHHVLNAGGGAYARLIQQAGFGDARPLQMGWFAGALAASGSAKVVYHLSHDDCGNAAGSARTMQAAVNGAPLVGDTRAWAEARARFAAGMTLLSAGTPMFFMGEETGAAKPFTFDTFMDNREDLAGEAAGMGANLFRCYQDLIRLRHANPALRSRAVEVAAADDANRVIAFHRWSDAGELLVVGNLGNAAFASGYWVHGRRIGDAGWTEIFNTDAAPYGGWGVGNAGATLQGRDGALNVVLPASGLVVLRRG